MLLDKKYDQRVLALPCAWQALSLVEFFIFISNQGVKPPDVMLSIVLWINVDVKIK